MKRTAPFFFLVFFLLMPPPVAASFYRPEKPLIREVSGIRIFILPDRRLPLVRATLFIRGGSVLDPFGKEGLSALAMESIRVGGATRKPSEIEEWIESVGGEMEFGTAPEFMTASLALLSKDLAEGLSLFFDLVRHPKVDSSQFNIIKKRMLDRLQLERENSLRHTMKEFPSLLDEKSWWGRREKEKSISRIRRTDVVSFHRRFFFPDRMVLAISGDVDPESLVKKITFLTEGWDPATEPLPLVPPLEKKFPTGFYLIPDKATQTTIVMGHFGEKRDNPDKYPLLVMNFILGGSGSLVSRLGEEIRTLTGRAYAIWSSFGFGRDFGIFHAVAQTASPNTESVVRDMKKIIEKMATNPTLTDDELHRAKESILRSFIFTYETKGALVGDLAKFYLWGYPDNYLEAFQRAIARVTKQEVERVAKKYLRPDGMRLLMRGDPQVILSQFKGKEKVQILERR